MDDYAGEMLSPSASADDVNLEGHWVGLALEEAAFAPAPRPMRGEEALRQAHKMAIVGQMAGGLAHDFNNLLQGVVGALDVMRRRIDQGRMDELSYPLDIAYMSLNRAADLTHRLLAFSRPHAVEARLVSVNEAIVSIAALLRCTVGSRIQLDLVLADGLGLARCDLHQLENVLLNLVINARDAMPDGGKLLIETFPANLSGDRQGMRRGRYVGLCVADSGIGMTPEVAKRAFDPFYTTKPAGRGTGLGLAMTRHFVEQFNGCANIESVIGQGTSVILYLPRANDDEEGKVIELADARAQ